MSGIRLCSRAVIGLLVGAGAALVVAFVFAPRALLSGTDPAFNEQASLQSSVGRGLVEYWRSDGPAYPDLLAKLVDYWFRWHAIKVGISALMLVVFGLLAVALWRRYLYGSARSAVGAIGATVFSVLATGLLILNVQATAVPVIALLPLMDGSELAGTLREMRAGLTAPADFPALTVLLGEVERYHWVMVAVAGTVMVATGLAAAVLWKRRGDSRVRFMRRTLSVTLALTAGLLLAVVVISALSAVEPEGALIDALGLG